MFFVWRHVSPFLWWTATSAGRPRTRWAAMHSCYSHTWSSALSSPTASTVSRGASPTIRIPPVVVATVSFLAVPVAISAVTVSLAVLALRRAVIVRRLNAFWTTFSLMIPALLILAGRVNTFDQKQEFHIFTNIYASIKNFKYTNFCWVEHYQSLFMV